MNYEDCLRDTIKSSLTDVLEQMKKLDGDDRCALILEFCEWVTDDDINEVLMVPRFTEGVI